MASFDTFPGSDAFKSRIVGKRIELVTSGISNIWGAVEKSGIISPFFQCSYISTRALTFPWSDYFESRLVRTAFGNYTTWLLTWTPMSVFIIRNANYLYPTFHMKWGLARNEIVDCILIGCMYKFMHVNPWHRHGLRGKYSYFKVFSKY
jgi:hypothetical protein